MSEFRCPQFLRRGRSLALLLLLLVMAAPAFAQGSGPYQFHALTPCRSVDTRTAGQGPALAADTDRSFRIQGTCGVPVGAKAVAFNVTVFLPNYKGHLRLYPADIARPNISSINFAGGETALANGAIVPLATVASGSDPDVKVYTFMVSASGTTHLILDVTGYFAAP